jgi:hypothetical protein
MTVDLFPLGRVVITPPALEAFDRNNQLPVKFLARHLLGDFGDLGEEDVRANHYAILNDLRVRSKYTLNDGTPIYVITEADRSSTCLMLVSD